MTEIPVDQINLSPVSLDRNGRLFTWSGGLYRAIAPRVSATYKSLFDNEVIYKLMEAGVVETELSGLRLSNYDLVLKHKVIPFQSYCFEWCGEMLRDAALLTCNVARVLAEHGLALQDAHPWNILFDGSRAKFVDFTSIIPVDWTNESLNFPRSEFWRFFINPLVLMAEGNGDLVRRHLRQHQVRGITQRGLQGLGASLRTRVRLWTLKARLALGEAMPGMNPHDVIRSFLESIDLRLRPSQWQNYYHGQNEGIDPNIEWTPKQRACYETVKRLRPRSVLDIGCNQGWYSKIASRLKSEVVAFDTDEPSVTSLYRHAREAGVGILPLVMDLCNPSPSFVDETLPDLEWPSAVNRLRSEMVLALALVHHLVFKQGQDFKQIVDRLDEFTSRYLLVEFIPAEDKYVKEWSSPRFGWYSLEGFMAALRKRFSHIEELESDPSPRKLLLCVKQ